MKMWFRVAYWNYGILLFPLFSGIRFVHVIHVHNVLGPSEACAKDWSEINSVWHPECASSKIEIAMSIA